MGKFVTVSLEGDEIKVIHSSTRFNIIHNKWDILHIEKWDVVHNIKKERIPGREFNAYLDRENNDEYVVVCDFEEYFHDVIRIPAIKHKYIKNVVESAIRKATQKTDFTFVHSILGEKIIDNKKMLEIFYYMVTNKAIHNVVQRFYDHGKIVKALYPAVFAAAVYITSNTSDEVRMGVLFSGHKRIVFTSKNGIVSYVRDYESPENSLSEFDIQNINMTLTYCSEKLRIEPESIIFLGCLKGVNALKDRTAVPVIYPDMPGNVECDGEVDCDYSIVCSAQKVSRKVSILSENFKNVYLLRRLLEAASMTFVLLSMIYFVLVVYVVNDLFQTRQELRSVNADLSGIEEHYEEYMKRVDTLNTVTPFVEFLNKPSINIDSFLIEMSGIELQQMRIDSIDATADEEASFVISINGRGEIDTHSSFQASFDKLVESLEQMNNIELRSKNIDHMGKTFQVQLYYGK